MSLFFQIVNGERIGTTFLNSRGIFAESRWYWIGLGGLIGFIIFFNFLFTLALTFLERAYCFLELPITLNL
jgi:Plant PDR ABC transporter associated